MKIMYLIYVGSNGIGGHFYSLKSTVEAVSENTQCIIVNIGKGKSPVINSMNSKIYNVIYPDYHPIATILDLMKIVKLEQPDAFHAFDINALFYTKIISHHYKKPYITTLCGGSNPIFYPRVNNLILFSNENRKYFEANPKYNNTNIHLIPNRIQRPVQDYNKIEEIRRKLDPKARIFLRIARISSFHKDSILQSIALINALNKENVRSQLVIVGSIQDLDIYDEIAKQTEENTILLTDERYTINASEIIDVSELVIGTGRGFMEGASMKKILLCPSTQSEYPILATKDNLFDLFDNNFSVRSYDDASTNTSNLNRIIQVLQNDDQRSALEDYMQQISQDYFEIEPIVGKYMEIYKELKYDPRIDILDTFIHHGLITYDNSPLLRLLLQPIKSAIRNVLHHKRVN
jgi:glycosyltransferase involved in cell wall biosynthesis